MNAGDKVTIKGMTQNGGDYELRATVYAEHPECLTVKTKSGAILSLKHGQVWSLRGPRLRVLAVCCWIDG